MTTEASGSLFVSLTGARSWDVIQLLDLTPAVFVAGFGLVTLGRVMSRAAEMRDDVNATI